jgi:hypothetical protein
MPCGCRRDDGNDAATAARVGPGRLADRSRLPLGVFVTKRSVTRTQLRVVLPLCRVVSGDGA